MRRLRTPEEIVVEIKASRGFLDFTLDALLHYLPFEHAREFLKEGTTAAEWAEATKSTDRTVEGVMAEARAYAAFAWSKVEDHRGISASRSIDKMSAWVWLLSDDDLLAKVEAAPYPQYGAPKLKAICEGLGFPVPDSKEIDRMCKGKACHRGCANGCG